MTDREHAIEYRRQLLRIVDSIERDHKLGEHAIEYRRRLLRIVDSIERDHKLGKHSESAPCDCGKCEPEMPFDTEIKVV